MAIVPPDATSAASSVDIEEIDGPQRRIRLLGRALPFQGVEWASSTKTKVHWYPGNPVATMQVIGPQLDPTTMHGTWSDRFLPGQVDQEGFGAGHLATAEDMVAAFESIRDTGARLRVQWGVTTRFGILTRFVPSWIRPQDVNWSLEFTWYGKEEAAPRAGTNPAPSSSDLRRATTALDDDFMLDPPQVDTSFLHSIQGRIDSIRGQVGQVFDGLRTVQREVNLPANAVRQVVAAVEDLREQTNEVLQTCADVPYVYAQTLDSVVDVLSVESWRRLTALRARQQRAVAQEQGDLLAAQADPAAVQIITVPQDTTLRQIAAQVYGNADDWQLLADVNDLVGSIVEAGTRIIVPVKPKLRTTG